MPEVSFKEGEEKGDVEEEHWRPMPAAAFYVVVHGEVESAEVKKVLL